MMRNLMNCGLVKSTNLIKSQPSTLICVRNLKSKNEEHRYGVERVQYLTMQKKAKIQQESDHVLVLEDTDMLSVYLTKKVKRTQTTLENPIYVPSWENTRMICCHCDVEGLDLTYTLLEKNKTMKCDCGYHFRLIDQVDPFSNPAAAKS